jgi:hypothetical protein
MKTVLALLCSFALTGALTGCARFLNNVVGTPLPEPLPSPSPYRFVLESFEDMRDPNDADKWQSPYPFRTAQFMQSWQSVWRTATFGENPATLALVLRNYASSKSPSGEYALSAHMDLRGTDAYGRRLGMTAGQCSVVVRPGFDLDDRLLAAQTVGPDDAGHGCSALTPCATEARMWRLAMTNCVRQLAGQFSQAIHTTGVSPKEMSCGNRAC